MNAEEEIDSITSFKFSTRNDHKIVDNIVDFLNFDWIGFSFLIFIKKFVYYFELNLCITFLAITDYLNH